MTPDYTQPAPPVDNPGWVQSGVLAEWLQMNRSTVRRMRLGRTVPWLDSLPIIRDRFGWSLDDQVTAYQAGCYPGWLVWHIDQYARSLNWPDCLCGCGESSPGSRWLYGHHTRWLWQTAQAAVEGNHPQARAQVELLLPNQLDVFDRRVALVVRRLRQRERRALEREHGDAGSS